MPEYFDIVDENDNIIGKAPRQQCHSNPKLIHRGIFVIVENEAKFAIKTSEEFVNKIKEPLK